MFSLSTYSYKFKHRALAAARLDPRMSEYQFQVSAPESKVVPVTLRGRSRDRVVSKQRPRVLMVGMHLTKTRGGITTLTTDILDSTLNQDYEFIYIASQAEDFGKFSKILLASRAVCKFVWTCLFRSPRLIYVHIGSNASLYRESAFIILGRIMRRPVISHFHAGDIDNYFPRQPAIGKKFILFAIGLSHSVIAVSRESARQLGHLDNKLRISIIPNAIDLAGFQNNKRVPYKSGKNDPVRLLFVGAVGKLKGENDLIRALAILRDQGSNVRASFLGYGAESLADNCAKYGVMELIEHLGPVAMRERIAFYERADIFVLPTHAEAMPISVIEAMAAGLPIISTAVGGIPEILDHGEEGLLFPAGNVKALAETIAVLVKNKQMRLKMGRNARKRARKQMNFSMYIERLRGEFIRLIETDSNI